jgi:hypothetical protein
VRRVVQLKGTAAFGEVLARAVTKRKIGTTGCCLKRDLENRMRVGCQNQASPKKEILFLPNR